MLRNIILLPVVVTLAILLALWSRTPPSGDAGTGFRLSEAQETLRAIAAEPRPVGSVGHDKARDWLLARMGALGLRVETQKGVGVRQAVFDTRRKGAVSVAPYENIIAVLPGRDPSAKAVLLMAHYDSVEHAPGASDDGAGVAALVETARVMAAEARAGTAPYRDTIFLFSDAEEVGLIGAQQFFDANPLARRVGAVVNVEARGSRGRAFMFQTSPGNAALVDLWAAHAAGPTGNSLAGAVYKLLPNDTDLSVPLAKGVTGINAAYIDGLYDYHMPTDSIANTDPRSVQHLGNFALTTTRALADAKALPDAAEGSEDSAYFDIFGLFVLRYPVWGGWVLLALGGLALAFAGVGRLGVGAKQAALGTLASATLFVATGTASHFLGNLAYGKDMHALRDRINEMDAALWVWVGLCAGAVLFVRMRAALWVGCAILLLLVGAAAQIWLPGGAWLFQWAGVIGAALIFLAARKGIDHPATLYASAGVGGLWGAILLAGIISTYMSVAPATPTPVALIMPFAVALLGPVIIAFCRAGWGRPAAVVLLVGAMVGLGWFALKDGYNSRHPESADLFHYAEGVTGTAWWASGSGTGQLPSGPRTTLSPGAAPALKWSAVPAPTSTLVVPPIIQSLTGTRREIAWSSATAPAAMILQITPRQQMRNATVNGKPVGLAAGEPTRIAWRGQTAGAELRIAFDTTASGSIDVAWLYGTRGMPASAPQPRGVPTDWTAYNASRMVSGVTKVRW